MILEGRTRKIIREMHEQGKVKRFNLETKEYVEGARYIRDNWKSELKEKGILVSMIGADYPINVD